MTYAEFQDHWEKAAHSERQQFDSESVQELLTRLSNNDYGNYYQIWYSIGERATINDIGQVFMAVLRSQEDYLIRYHCAAALLGVFNPYPHVLNAAKLSGREKYNVDIHLDEYESELKKLSNQAL